MKKITYFVSANMSRLNSKLKEIEEYLLELSEIVPESYDEYANNIKTRAACERYFEKIVEAIVDSAFLMIKENSFKMPEDDKGAFDVLANENIIPQELAERLKNAKGMRNLIAHRYSILDDETIFNSITEELKMDAKLFIKNLRMRI